MKTNKLTNFLTVLGNQIEDENVALYRKIIEGSCIKSFNGPDEFYYAVLYPWSNFISGFLKTELKANEDVEFIYKYSQFLDAHFSNLFSEFEGSACSADKSRTVVGRLLKFYDTGERIDFNYDGEYTYHLPTKILKRHDQIVEFYKGLRELMYGAPDKYLKALKDVASCK